MLKDHHPTFYKTLIITLLVSISPCHAGEEEAGSLFDLSLADLQNIEISTAGKTKEKIKDIPASVIIVSRSDIEDYGYTTLTDILENVPGLYNIYSYNGAPGNLGVRGFWNAFSQNSNIAFLVNGVKQINDDTQSNPMAKITVPVEAIDRIEIIKGPMSVMYGSGASFGVINIITNEISENNDVSLASLTYGTRDTKKAVVRISQNTEDLKLVFNASEYKTDGLDNKFTDMMGADNQALLPFLGVTDPDYSTKDLLENRNQYIGISGSYKKLYFDTAFNNTNVDIYAVAPSLRSGIERTSENLNLTLGYKDDVNDWFSFDTHVAYFDHKDGDVIDFIDPTAYGTRDVNYNAWEAEFVAAFKPNQQWNIIAGLYQRTMTNHFELFDVPVPQSGSVPIHQTFERSDKTTQAVFTQATYSPYDKLTLVAGVRWENNLAYDTTGLENIGLPGEQPFGSHVASNNHFLPRIAAIYHFNHSNTLKVLYGEASKLVADDTNIPEDTRTFEINYIYTKNQLSFTSSIFFNELDNLFTEDIINDGGQLEYVRVRGGKIRTKGIELIIQNYFNENLFGELSYTYQESEDINNSTSASYSPDNVLQAKASYKYQLNTYSLLGRYVDSMKPPFDVGDTASDYLVFDANYRRDNLIGKTYINLKINNLFDEQVRYPNNTELNELLDKGTIGAERSIYATIGWKF